ncbi:MAG: response regulator transcription factor [Acidimicrobiales bacterium]
MARLLLVDDDPSLLRALQIGLKARGHEVVAVRSAQEGIDQCALFQPDVMLLDLGLPDIDGVEVVRRVREWSMTSILVLSAADDDVRKVTALDAGADDYLTKPFSMAELEARVRVALRHRVVHSVEPGTSIFELGRLRVDLASRSAVLDGVEVELTAREFDLLAYLMRHAGKVCTHQMILHDVWGTGYGQESHYLRVYVNRLRRKLHDDRATLIRTSPGVGYQYLGE